MAITVQLPTCIVKYLSKFNGGAGDSATSLNAKDLMDDSSSSTILRLLLLTFSSKDPFNDASKKSEVEGNRANAADVPLGC